MIAASPMMLAALLNPALFWGGAAAVSVPILIHLLARRRFRRIRWAAMAFLVDAEKRNRRRVRIEELILLALRCLAVFLIGLFIARPFMKATGIAAVLGGSERTERIFLLDDSFSMGYVSEGRGNGPGQGGRDESWRLPLPRRHRHAAALSSELAGHLCWGALLDDKQINGCSRGSGDQAVAALGVRVPGRRGVSEASTGTMGATHPRVLVTFQQRILDWVSGGSAGAGAKKHFPASGLEAWAARRSRLGIVDVRRRRSRRTWR
ncbi:MAG: BatA domain-containing protein [Phycisphaerales bacterium]|nr:BatA domain-containing protein [Phycisphaerales bacterium]